jgi:GT2 family glycosyltransferase
LKGWEGSSMASQLDPVPMLSLVVATFGRRSEVIQLLQSIPVHNRRQIEIVVVDQNEKPLVEELALSRVPVSTHLYARIRNANAARNQGAAHAKAAWLMFPDDDATFHSDALDQFLNLIGEDRFDLISGQIVDDDGTPHLLRWLTHPAAITPQTLDATLVESSFAIRRDLFNAVGGFDPLFGPGSPFHSAEGADLVRRLWRHGHLRSWFTPEIALRHPAKSDEMTVAARERVYNFAIGEGALTARHHPQLPMMTISRKLLFRVAGVLLTSGEKRRRKIAFLSGFVTGVFRYHKLQRDHITPRNTFLRNSVL